jgi:multimeric flavodoxin WrbA
MVEAKMHAVASSRGVALGFETLFLADDDVALIRRKMDAADGLIVASPVYVDDVSGRIKN